MNEDTAINIGKISISANEWYVSHYTPSISEQAILSNRILSTLPTELHYVKRSVLIKEVQTQNFWTFEIGTQEGINVRIWISVGFEQRDRQGSQILNNETFYRPPVTSTQCIIGTVKYPDSAFLLNYNDDDYSQGFGQNKEIFRALVKDDILETYISDHDVRSSNDDDDIG